MRSFKNIISALGICLITINIQAQDKTLLQTEMLAKQLELTDKQKSDLDKQLKQAKADREALQDKMKALQEEMRRDAFVKQQEREAQMKALLTPEQFAKFQELQKSSRKRQFEGRRGQGEFRQRFRGERSRTEFRRRFREEGRAFRNFRGNGQNREELMKKFQEFLEQEKKENGGN